MFRIWEEGGQELVGQNTEFQGDVHVENYHVVRNRNRAGGEIQGAPNPQSGESVDNPLDLGRRHGNDCQVDAFGIQFRIKMSDIVDRNAFNWT